MALVLYAFGGEFRLSDTVTRDQLEMEIHNSVTNGGTDFPLEGGGNVYLRYVGPFDYAVTEH